MVEREGRSTEKLDNALTEVSKAKKPKYIWKENDGKARRSKKEDSKDVAKVPMNESERIAESVFKNLLPQAQTEPEQQICVC